MNYATLKSALLLGLAPLAALCLMSAAQAQTSPPAATSASMPMGQMHKGGAGAHDMKQQMMMGMDKMQKMPMSGDVDKDFAMMMKMHHSKAVEMAEMEIAHGKSPEMKSMAKKIIKDQNKEIAQFEKWLAKQK